MRALVIDASPSARRLGRELLERAGFAVAEAEDGGGALDLLDRDGPVDLALFDWRMLPVSGYAFARAVRAQPRFDAMHLVMVTDETSGAYHLHATEAGAETILLKPLTASALAIALTRAGLQPTA